MLKKLYTLFTFLILASCSVPNWWKPQGYRLFSHLPKNSPPGFRLGWIHGCESGLGSQFGGAIKMSFYTWSKDPDISSSNPNIPKIRDRYKKELKDINWDDINEVKKNFSDYNTIFWTAHSFCRHSALQEEQSADMEPPLPGDARYNPAAHSLSNVWKIDGRGDSRIGSQGLW